MTVALYCPASSFSSLRSSPFSIERIVRVHLRQPSSGREEMIGKDAEVRTPLTPEGLVFIEGERWDAVSESGNIEPGEEVTVTKVEGLSSG